MKDANKFESIFYNKLLNFFHKLHEIVYKIIFADADCIQERPID